MRPWSTMTVQARRGLGPALVALMLAMAAATPAASASGAAEAPSAQRERTGPADVPPVVHRGVRYEVVHWGKERGLSQNGGLVEAIDAKTGKSLWLAQIYAIDYSVDKEPDRLDVFIVSLALDRNGRQLLVKDENGRRFSLDLASRKVTTIAQPPRR